MQHEHGRCGARRRILWTAVTLWALLALLAAPGCSKKDEGTPAAQAAGKAEAAEAASAAAPEAAPSPMQKTLTALGKPISRAATQATEAQLAVTGAKSAELLDVSGTALRVGLLRYESPTAAAKALQQVVLWINGSGLLHHGEATADGDTVIVVGTVDDTPPTPETRALFDQYIDGFLEAE
ncbi:MAG: hypothetical protein R3F39_14335 [Myxococcota bacterium]